MSAAVFKTNKKRRKENKKKKQTSLHTNDVISVYNIYLTHTFIFIGRSSEKKQRRSRPAYLDGNAVNNNGIFQLRFQVLIRVKSVTALSKNLFIKAELKKLNEYKKNLSRIVIPLTN